MRELIGNNYQLNRFPGEVEGSVMSWRGKGSDAGGAGVGRIDKIDGKLTGKV
jgi:hypothetical protein